MKLLYVARENFVQSCMKILWRNNVSLKSAAHPSQHVISGKSLPEKFSSCLLATFNKNFGFLHDPHHLFKTNLLVFKVFQSFSKYHLNISSHIELLLLCSNSIISKSEEKMEIEQILIDWKLSKIIWSWNEMDEKRVAVRHFIIQVPSNWNRSNEQ